MSEHQPDQRDQSGAPGEPDGEYTEVEDAQGRREEPVGEPAGTYVDVDETHVASGVEGQYTDVDGENVPDSEELGHYTDTDQ